MYAMVTSRAEKGSPLWKSACILPQGAPFFHRAQARVIKVVHGRWRNKLFRLLSDLVNQLQNTLFRLFQFVGNYLGGLPLCKLFTYLN